MSAVESPAETITLETIKQCTTPTSADHDVKFGVPTLEELGTLRSKSSHCWSFPTLIRIELYLDIFFFKVLTRKVYQQQSGRVGKQKPSPG